MGYYIRYISDDDREINISILESALRSKDMRYEIVKEKTSTDFGRLTFDGELYGQIEINSPGDGLYEEELEELKESLSEYQGRKKKEVLRTLTNARMIIAIQVLWQDRTVEQTLCKIDPLWSWLFANRKGLLQADGEGYYEKDRLILEER